MDILTKSIKIKVEPGCDQFSSRRITRPQATASTLKVTSLEDANRAQRPASHRRTFEAALELRELQ